MDEVFVFNKSYQDRYMEYTSVFGGYEILPASKIKREWSYYLELTVDPCGWQAIWKIPRLKCEKLCINFPTIVLVYVNSTDFNKMTSIIKVLAVQDDIHIPSKHEVPLTQLWITKGQDKSIGLNLESTANSLDMLHFFYMNIFLPWDLDEDDATDWLSNHLESRLRLSYDMRNGKIPRTTVDHLKSLLSEAYRLQARKEQIELDIGDTVLDNEENNTDVRDLCKIHIKLKKIRFEVEVLENPVLRSNTLEMEQEEANSNSRKGSEYWVVFEQGTIDEFISFLNCVKHTSDNIKSVSTLILALYGANSKDTIILNPSRHMINTLGNLQNGGILKGLCDKSRTVIYGTNEYVLLDINGDVTLENLTIDVGSAQIGIIIRCGTATLKNCVIVGNGETSIHQGVIVFAGSKLDMIECEMVKFYTAIVGNSGSSIGLQKCTISDGSIALKIYDNCKVKIENSKIYNCKEYGIFMETDTILNTTVRQVGDFSMLEMIPDVVVKNLERENGGKGDVIIHQKPKLEPVTDLFSNPTLEMESEDEMDINKSNEGIPNGNHN